MILAGVLWSDLFLLAELFTNQRTYFENQKIASIENRVDSFIENKYN